MILPLVTETDSILRSPTVSVLDRDIDTDWFQSFVSDLIESMLHYKGVGLAAPQVGRSLSVCVLRHQRFPNPLVLINPVYSLRNKETKLRDEACLSILGRSDKVRRFENIRVKAWGIDGGKVEFKRVTGFLASIFQHEIDHLDGVLYVDKVGI